MEASRAGVVRQHILNVIRDEGLTAGSRLPSVRQLSLDCGVTAPTVREALRSLEAAGVVEMQHGSGTYVRDGAFRLILANGAAIPGPDHVANLLSARLLLEPSIAAQAAFHRTDEDADELLECAEAAALSSLPPGHVSFHVLVAQATGNPVIADVIVGLLNAQKSTHTSIRKAIVDRDEDQRHHHRIAIAIRDGEPSEAEQAMKDHLLWLTEQMNCSPPQELNQK